jgi:hypothetical protein
MSLNIWFLILLSVKIYYNTKKKKILEISKRQKATKKKNWGLGEMTNELHSKREIHAETTEMPFSQLLC